MRERDVMTAIVISKVDVLGLRMGHSVVMRLATMIMCRQIVDRLIDNAIVARNLQRSSLRFSEDDLPLCLSRFT